MFTNNTIERLHILINAIFIEIKNKNKVFIKIRKSNIFIIIQNKKTFSKHHFHNILYL